MHIVSCSQLTVSNNCIMSSCVKPTIQKTANPLVLLHGFDSSCLEWRYTLPLLEQAGFETWAIDILGWGFSNLEKLPLCNVESKRDHLYQFWKSYIGRPMVLVGPSLGAAVAIDFAINYPEAVDKLILIDASVYAEGTGTLSRLPKFVAYASVSVLKSFPLRLFATSLQYNSLSFNTCLDWTREATVDFMNSGGYNVTAQIHQRLHCELPNAIIRQIPECGHYPHIEKPDTVTKLIKDFIETNDTPLPLFSKPEEKVST
ncbi:putative alpha/beta hydrolase-1, epoxide hydrolase, serine aminopeptidase, S33 [Helianthus annuus]|nr:putative alpha/beta hydrolase-1, epoxide hydrolase, serine aminopeptidase, S33 [Helianthus annuus]